MQAEVQKLKEQLSIEAAEREKDKEKIQQLEQQLETPQPEEFTTNTTTSIYNKVSENEVADLAQAGTETALATHNEPSNGPTIVPTPSQGPEHVQQTVADSVLLTKQMRIPPCRLTGSNANRSLFTNDKGSSESVRFITSQTLRNSAANKKRDTRKKGGKDNQH
ncbi:hypothetical protein BDA96_10G198200 [Sorghum bicolor]|uniref:Uncharacterized protein n=1 Tax=Sorghum bicolor TaxID=4558 RepID=A0A921U1J0_SORBI|nr:hypothetical protein BDA96_10G198200 [Sorghum bicolor]